MRAPFEGDTERPTGTADPLAAAPQAEVTAEVDLVWRCAECGYQRLEVSRPDHCQSCGADGSRLVGRTAIEWRFLLRHPAH